MATIFHIALASDWEDAKATGAYTASTLGRSLAEEGFIHASRADQWTAVRDRFYARVTEPLLLLQIDTDLLDVPVVEEPAVAGGAETFPHIYGPLRPEAVIRAMTLPAASATGTATSAAPTGPASFSALFLGEMFAHMLIAGVVLAGLVVGIAAGAIADSPVGMLVGAVAGAAVGLVVARLLYVRRERARTA